MKKLILSTLLAFSSISQAEVIHLYSPTGFLESSFERDRVRNVFTDDGKWLVGAGVVAIAPTPTAARILFSPVVDECRNTWGLMHYEYSVDGKPGAVPWDYAKGTGVFDRLAKAICAVGARKLIDSK
jgi:hypothetical protein